MAIEQLQARIDRIAALEKLADGKWCSHDDLNASEQTIAGLGLERGYRLPQGADGEQLLAEERKAKLLEVARAVS